MPSSRAAPGAPAARTVLFLHSSAGRYGADVQLLALARELDRDRFLPRAVLPERGELATLLEDAEVAVEVRPLAVLRRELLGPVGMAETARRLADDRRELAVLARATGAAIVHSNTSVVLGGPAAARAAGARHVVHVREIYTGAAGPAGAALWPLLRRRLRRADALVCISDAVGAQFEGSARARVIRDGLAREPRPVARAEARATLGLAPEPFVVALVGRISEWKGQRQLAAALADPALAEIGALGILAGDAWPGREPLEHELRETAHTALGGRLRLLGFRSDLDTVLGAADAVAVPSTRPEPLGQVALEAAAAGLPVVASAHGGLPEAVRHDESGLLVPPGDPPALAAALRSLADDPGRAKRLGAIGAEHVRRRFDLGRMVREIEALYGELLEGR